jgi:hypothetical protein
VRTRSDALAACAAQHSSAQNEALERSGGLRGWRAPAAPMRALRRTYPVIFHGNGGLNAFLFETFHDDEQKEKRARCEGGVAGSDAMAS